MKLRHAVLALVLVLLCSTVAQAKIATENLFIEAVMTRDTASLEKLLAANYLHINGNGYLQDKENFIANLKNGKMVIDRLSFTDVNISHYGDATMVTGTVILRGKFEPKLPQGLQRATMVMEKKDGQDKVILFQTTPVRKGSHNTEDPTPTKGKKGKASKEVAPSATPATPAAPSAAPAAPSTDPAAPAAPAATPATPATSVAPVAPATPTTPATAPAAPATEVPKAPAAQ